MRGPMAGECTVEQGEEVCERKQQLRPDGGDRRGRRPADIASTWMLRVTESHKGES